MEDFVVCVNFIVRAKSLGDARHRAIAGLQRLTDPTPKQRGLRAIMPDRDWRRVEDAINFTSTEVERAVTANADEDALRYRLANLNNAVRPVLDVVGAWQDLGDYRIVSVDPVPSPAVVDAVAKRLEVVLQGGIPVVRLEGGGQ